MVSSHLYHQLQLNYFVFKHEITGVQSRGLNNYMKVDLKLVGHYSNPGEIVTVEVEDDSKTLHDVRDKVLELNGSNIEESKIIYHQKIIQMDSKLSDFKYQEGTPILVFLQKPKPSQEEKSDENKAKEEEQPRKGPRSGPLPVCKSMNKKVVCPPNRHRRTDNKK